VRFGGLSFHTAFRIRNSTGGIQLTQEKKVGNKIGEIDEQSAQPFMTNRDQCNGMPNRLRCRSVLVNTSVDGSGPGEIEACGINRSSPSTNVTWTNYLCPALLVSVVSRRKIFLFGERCEGVGELSRKDTGDPCAGG